MFERFDDRFKLEGTLECTKIYEGSGKEVQIGRKV